MCLDGIANKAKQEGAKKIHPISDDFNLYLLIEITKYVEENNFYGIIDFGAGHSIFESEQKFNEAQELLRPFKNIILLKYSDDIEKSLSVLNSRSSGDTSDNFHFMTSNCNPRLATMVVYTEGKTIEQVAKEIITKTNTKEITKK